MKKKNSMKITAAALAALTAVSFSGCSSDASENTSADTAVKTQTAAAVSSLSEDDLSVSAEDKDIGYEESDSTVITLNGTSGEVRGAGAEISDGKLAITEAGSYVLSGNFKGQIYINSKGSEIKLVLDGLSVENDSHAALLADKASKVTLTLNEGTQNSFSDGASYTLADSGDNTDAAVFSRADLTINGEGALTVNGNYKHGIVSKDGLVITGGDLTVESQSTAISGKDSVKISGGQLDITAGSNGITSTDSEDASKGFVVITGGTAVINSAGDGIQAETTLHIEGGTVDITTGGGSANASMKSDGTPNGGWGNWDRGMQGMAPPDGDFGGGGMQDFQPVSGGASVVNMSAVSDTSESGQTSAKALKAGTAIEIDSGSIRIDSSDDSVHSNGSISISGGELTAASGDDGIHADGDLTISGGIIDISKSYEGIEGLNIEVSGGDVKVKASDDGFNAAGGSDTGSQDRMGRDAFNTTDGASYKLTISGGNVYVDSEGDGLDSNGDFYMTGGTVFVDGPVNGGNGAIDIGDFGCTAQITGGTIIAAGSVGMEVGFDESSTQYSILHYFSSPVSGGSEFTVTDSSGKVIFSYAPSKDYQSVVFSSPDLTEGSYTLSAGGSEETVEISSIVTSNSSGMGGGFGGRGGFGGGDMQGMTPPDDGFGGGRPMR